MCIIPEFEKKRQGDYAFQNYLIYMVRLSEKRVWGGGLVTENVPSM